jgi:hypothetical protein
MFPDNRQQNVQSFQTARDDFSRAGQWILFKYNQ